MTNTNSTPSLRLTRLADGRLGLRSALPVSIREPSTPPVSAPPVPATPPVLDFVASNETVDRFDEIILAGGWRLENYRRNPVFQNAHQYGDVVHTLGRALLTEVRSGGTGSAGPHLFQRIEFAVDVNPLARIAYGLYKGKFLNAVSVGFIPLRWETPADPQKAGYRRKYLEQELLEVSAVGIPANPDALQARVILTGGYVVPGAVPAAGQTALPADLEQAAVEQVAYWFANRERLGLLRIWEYNGTYRHYADLDLLRSVKAVLFPYTRWEY